ncbi:HipA domain-containing protein [Shewanella chilikensis]|uniref:HipA domain-containing protein n=1 Tax=Shewanella chilikensis TaxID=558541 RepID=UPI00399B3F53
MGISKPSQGWAKHQKDMAVLSSDNRGGSYRLSPFYDILSAYPLMGRKGLNIQQLKLGMGLETTKGKKYEINKILPRHFLDTAKAVNFSQDKMQRIMDEMKQKHTGHPKHFLSSKEARCWVSVSDK